MPAKYLKNAVLSYSMIWEDGFIFLGYEQAIRSSFKDCMDRFLNIYLEANPRKFIEEKQIKKEH